MEELRRRIDEKINASKEEQLRKEQFQESCRILAVTLFDLLRAHDPWCKAIEFEGPLPLGPSSAVVPGVLQARLDDITGDEAPPRIEYPYFEINIPGEGTWSVQEIRLSWRRDEPGAMKWELETLVSIPGVTFPVSKFVHDPATIGRIQEGIQGWSCKPTNRNL